MLFLYCLVSFIAIFLQKYLYFVKLVWTQLNLKWNKYFFINSKLPLNFQLETGDHGLNVTLVKIGIDIALLVSVDGNLKMVSYILISTLYFLFSIFYIFVQSFIVNILDVYVNQHINIINKLMSSSPGLFSAFNWLWKIGLESVNLEGRLFESQ